MLLPILKHLVLISSTLISEIIWFQKQFQPGILISKLGTWDRSTKQAPDQLGLHNETLPRKRNKISKQVTNSLRRRIVLEHMCYEGGRGTPGRKKFKKEIKKQERVEERSAKTKDLWKSLKENWYLVNQFINKGLNWGILQGQIIWIPEAIGY